MQILGLVAAAFVLASVAWAQADPQASSMDQPLASEWRQFSHRAQEAFKSNNLDEASSLWCQAVKLAEKDGQIQPGLVDCLKGLALLNEKKGNAAEAERLYELAMRDLEATAGSNSIIFAEYMPDLAWLYVSHGKIDKAELLFRRALKIKEEHLGQDSAGLVPDLNNYAEFLRIRDRVIEANLFEQRARSIHAKTN